VVSGRPRVDHHHAEVGDAAPPHRFLPAGILPDDLFGSQEFLEHDGRLDAPPFGPYLHVTCGERDDGLVRGVLGSLAQDEVGLAVYRLAFFVAQDGVLVRLAQGDVDEAGAVFELAVALEDAGGGLDLSSGQRVQGVVDLSCRRRGVLRGRHLPLPSRPTQAHMRTFTFILHLLR
jgi:hypothetical protein